MKLWVKNAPVYGVNTNDEIINFINEHITCQLPDPYINPQLSEFVKKFQMHSNCGISCKRIVKKNKNCIVKCRYGFPRKISDYTTLNSLENLFKERQKSNHINLF